MKFDERSFFQYSIRVQRTEYGVGSYTSDNPINFIGIEEIHSKCDGVDASIVNGKR